MLNCLRLQDEQRDRASVKAAFLKNSFGKTGLQLVRGKKGYTITRNLFFVALRGLRFGSPPLSSCYKDYNLANVPEQHGQDGRTPKCLRNPVPPPPAQPCIYERLGVAGGRA